MSRTGPLEGYRVIDMGRLVAAPFAAQILGDLGAEVIKVERIGTGDELRRYGPAFVEDPKGQGPRQSGYYMGFNRNKKSIEVDFSNPKGAEIVRRLAAGADVLIENYKTGTLARHGLDYAGLKAQFPKLVYCSVTGFGQNGPYARRGGVDAIFQAMSGWMSVTGEPDGDPQRVGIVAIDILTGCYAANAIQAALLQRARTGQGTHIDLALMDVGVSAMSHRAMEYLLSGILPQRIGNASSGGVPMQLFRASDGHINIQAGADHQFQQLCELIDRPDLGADPRFDSRDNRVANQGALIPQLEAIFATRRVADWYAYLEPKGVVCAPVYAMDTVFADPQVVHRQMAVTAQHAFGIETPLVASPIRMGGLDHTDVDAPPVLGQHTREVLTDLLGLSAAEAEALAADGVIGKI